jgi:hypothetical protein
MIVTDHFVYLHVSRSGGTFLNKLIMEHVPGAHMVQYHGHLEDLPDQFSHLPVIGFVRNPWDWYVSMFFDYKRKRQYVFQTVSDLGRLQFRPTLTRFLNLGDGSEESQALLEKLTRRAPRVINTQRPARNELPGLRSEHFANYPQGVGYYSWLVDLMFHSERSPEIHIGRFEDLRDEALRLFEETGTPITKGITDYLGEAKPLNSSPRPRNYSSSYSPQLEQLVATKDGDLIKRFDYTFGDS